MRLALFAAILPVVGARQDETPKQRQALVAIGHLAMGVLLYSEFNGAMPGSLRDLVERPKDAEVWPEGGFYPGGKIPKDPWGNDYRYEPGKREPKVWTWGADGKKGGEGEDRDLGLDDVFPKRRQQAKRVECRYLIQNLTQATMMYLTDFGAYPPSGNANLAKALSTPGAKKQPYFEFRKEDLSDKGEILDPWKRSILYRNNRVNWPGNQSDPDAHNKQSFDIYSFGPDGKDEKGAGDDVNNWE
ncbi:MAG: type II secretion system protein GspG [Planctomycetes bacterium]|nr:type II secretion system protein GspG [Planctomycetota bacterium]